MPIPLPFPQIFTQNIQRHGEIGQGNRPHEVDVEDVPVLTRLANSSRASEIYEQNAEDLKRRPLSKQSHPNFSE